MQRKRKSQQPCATAFLGVHRARGGSGLLRRRHDAGRVRELGRPKTPKHVPQRLRVGVFNGGVDWDGKSEPLNLPLGYTRGTYKAELARRARIYANWGKTT
jgi:hypothetical protein